jgi:uncharacterized protein YkwD
MARRAPSLICLLAAFAAFAVLLPGTALGKGSTQSAAAHTAALDAGVLVQLNRIRIAHHLVPLTLSRSLSLAANQHSQDMVARGYFEHNSANGTPFWKRIQAYYPEQSFRVWSVGENLFWSSGSVDATAGLKAWMASPEHRANILDPAWRQIGIAAVTRNDAPGTFAGLGVTVITTDFGTRHS